MHRLDVRVGPSAWRYAAGHSLVLLLSRASWPRFAPPTAAEPNELWLRGVRLHLPVA
jgi:predicted acyl esterase